MGNALIFVTDLPPQCGSSEKPRLTYSRGLFYVYLIVSINHLPVIYTLATGKPQDDSSNGQPHPTTGQEENNTYADETVVLLELWLLYIAV